MVQLVLIVHFILPWSRFTHQKICGFWPRRSCTHLSGVWLCLCSWLLLLNLGLPGIRWTLAECFCGPLQHFQDAGVSAWQSKVGTGLGKHKSSMKYWARNYLPPLTRKGNKMLLLGLLGTASCLVRLRGIMYCQCCGSPENDGHLFWNVLVWNCPSSLTPDGDLLCQVFDMMNVIGYRDCPG